MSPESYDIYHYLNRTPGEYVSLYQVVKCLGGSRSFAANRNWVIETLARMEAEGLVEKNDAGEFRIRKQEEDTTEFLRALQSPGKSSLGDTAIITLKDVGREK